jgi:uncharacterized membrane protein YeaQ/YmgE (transglycosylase-associated protein family)
MDPVRNKVKSNRMMKLWTATSFGLTILVLSQPAWAQAHDQTMYESAGIIAWIIVGLIGGYLASRVVNKSGEGMLRDIFLGILGGIVGGIIFRAFGSRGVTGFNVWSILVAFFGGVVVLVVYHAIRGRRAY